MILHELRELALREGLVDDPAFESKPVPWIIVLEADGTYSGLRDTYQEVPLPEGKKGKPKRQAAMMSIPRRRIRSSNDAADFLVDKSEYVLGIDPEAKRSQDVLTIRRDLFSRLLVEASVATSSVLGKAVTMFLSDHKSRAQCILDLLDLGYAGNDLFTFRVEGDFLHQDSSLLNWWRQRTERVPEDGGVGRQCLLCGQNSSALALHAKLQIPGGAPGGSPLIAFNQKAFEKYGFEDTENAPVCRTCMTSYVEGLRRLLNSRYVTSGDKVLLPQKVQLSKSTVAVYWANIQDSLVGTLSDLMYSPQKVNDLLTSPHRGQHSSGAAGRFFCLLISGAQGRAMVRGMHTGTVGQLEGNLARFFDAVRLEGDQGEPKPLGFLLRSLVLQGKLDRLPPGLAGEVFLGILFGRPMPRLVLASAVQRNGAEQKVTPERAALLQLFFSSHSNYEVPTMSLDAVTTDAPYRLGRLLSAYEQLQYQAHSRRSPGSKLNRTLVDRNYLAASTRPGVVFAQLARLSQSHIAILRRYTSSPDKHIVDICDGIEGIRFPAMLNLEEQGRFALGYYHQRQSFFRSKPAADTANELPTQPSEGDAIQ